MWHPWLCLKKCREARLSLNPEKCAFTVSKSILLGHDISADGLAIDRTKVDAILKSPPPKNLKQLQRFLGQVKLHNRFLKYVAHICIPLTALTKKDADPEKQQ